MNYNAEYVHEMVERLNVYRHEYYNENSPSVSDEVYDRLFDALKFAEQVTGIILSNLSTQTVGYKAVSALENVTHEIPLLSLDKSRNS